MFPDLRAHTQQRYLHISAWGDSFRDCTNRLASIKTLETISVHENSRCLTDRIRRLRDVKAIVIRGKPTDAAWAQLCETHEAHNPELLKRGLQQLSWKPWWVNRSQYTVRQIMRLQEFN